MDHREVRIDVDFPGQLFSLHFRFQVFLHPVQDFPEIFGAALDFQLTLPHFGKICQVTDQLVHPPSILDHEFQFADERRGQSLRLFEHVFTETDHS